MVDHTILVNLHLELKIAKMRLSEMAIVFDSLWLEFFARWKCFLGLETFDSPLYPTRNAYAKRRPSHQNGRRVISSPWWRMDWGGGCSQPFISSPRPPPALPCTLTTVKKQPLSPQNSGAGVLALASIYLNVELRMKHTKDAVKKDVWHKRCNTHKM